MQFKVGEIVEHILSKDWLLILDVDAELEQYYCRTKSHSAFWFKAFEVRAK